MYMGIEDYGVRYSTIKVERSQRFGNFGIFCTLGMTKKTVLELGELVKRSTSGQTIHISRPLSPQKAGINGYIMRI